MAADLGSIVAHLRLEMGQFSSALNQAQDRIGETSDRFRGLEAVGGTMKSIGTGMTVMGGAIVASMTKIISVSKDWDAEIAQQQFIYGKLEKSVQSFIDKGSKQAEAIGITEQQYKNNATALSNSLNLLGLSNETISKNGEQWMNLAADMGAFADVPIDTAIADMKSALVGNFNSLDKYGMSVNTATINNGEYAKSIGKTWEKMTQAEKAQAIMNETTRQGANFTGLAGQEAQQFGMSWNLAKQKFTETIYAFGSQLLPVLAPIVSKISDVIEAMGKWAEKNPKLAQGIMVAVGVIGLLLVTLGPILILVGAFLANLSGMAAGIEILKATRLASFLGKIPGPISLIKMAFSGVKTMITSFIIPAFKALFGVLIANPIILIIMAVIALVAAFIWAWNNVDGFKEFWIGLWESICDWCTKSTEFVFGVISSWGEAISTYFTVTLPTAFNALVDWFAELPGKIWNWLVATITKIVMWYLAMRQKAIQIGKEFIGIIIDYISQLPGKIWNWLVSVITKVSQFVSNMAKKGWEAAKEFTTNIINGIKGLPKQMWDIGADIVSGIINGIKSGATRLYNSLKDLAGNALEAAENKLKINSPSKEFANKIGKFIPSGIQVGVIANSRGLFDTMKNLSNQLVGSVNLKGLSDSVNIRTSDININNDSRLLSAITKLNNSITNNEKFDYDRLINGFEGAAKKMDSVIVMDKEVVGKKTAPTVKNENEEKDARMKRFRGEVGYV